MPGIAVKPRGREFCTDAIGCFPAKFSRSLENRRTAMSFSLKDDKDRLIGDWKRLRRGE